MSKLLTMVRKTVLEQRLLQKWDKILVACSGGPDSVGLFYILLELSQEYDLKIFLAHLNHGIREDADADEAFVRHIAEAEQIGIVSEKVDCLEISKKCRGSLEGVARRVRYEFLTRQARKLGASKIAMGHTADDQAETILMNLIRGTGLTGMAGMPPIRNEDGLSLIRPLLECERADILAYLSSRKIPYRTDKTNFEPCCTRNRIRLDLIPYIKREFNPSITRTLSRTAGLLREDHVALECFSAQLKHRYMEKDEKKKNDLTAGKSAFSWGSNTFSKFDEDKGVRTLNIDNLKALPLGIQQRILRESLALFYEKENSGRINFKHIKAILALINRPKGEKELSLPGGLKIYRNAEKLSLVSRDFVPAIDLINKSTKNKKVFWDRIGNVSGYPVKIPGTTDIPSLDMTLKAIIYPIKQIKMIPNDPMIAFLDYENVKKPIEIRTRMPGDRFHPLGMSMEKKLKDFFIDNKVSRRTRDSWPLLASGSQIFWVVGLRIGHPCRITSKTSKVLKIDCIYNGS